MKLLLKNKSLILSIVFLILSIFVFTFLYKTTKENIETSKVLQEKWQIESTRRENIRVLTNTIKSIENEKTLLETHFIKSSDVVPFLDKIEKLAKDAGVKAEVSSIDIPNNISSLMVEMKALGSFENIYKLILLLENSQYELKFVSVDLKNTNADNLSPTKTPIWSAIFEIELLSFIK